MPKVTIPSLPTPVRYDIDLFSSLKSVFLSHSMLLLIVQTRGHKLEHLAICGPTAKFRLACTVLCFKLRQVKTQRFLVSLKIWQTRLAFHMATVALQGSVSSNSTCPAPFATVPTTPHHSPKAESACQSPFIASLRCHGRYSSLQSGKVKNRPMVHAFQENRAATLLSDWNEECFCVPNMQTMYIKTPLEIRKIMRNIGERT